MTGIEATGAVYPLGAFLLVGAMLDMLAGLMHAPASDSDRQQGIRYAAFVDRFFDDRYRALGMGARMWRGLRCRPLHNFSAQGILLAPSLSTSGETLTIEESMTLGARTENAGDGDEHEWSWSGVG